LRTGQPQFNALFVKLALQRVEQCSDRINQILKKGVDVWSGSFRLCEIGGCILPVVGCADIAVMLGLSKHRTTIGRLFAAPAIAAAECARFCVAAI
ncbi:hypothetical protein, partial [Mesorhizobium sp. M0041]|uniref:hypothetical protein n=1 Tax=Mesorhizobium sp. M0041 TaxID=2956856 RepID=UPI0033350E38